MVKWLTIVCKRFLLLHVADALQNDVHQRQNGAGSGWLTPVVREVDE